VIDLEAVRFNHDPGSFSADALTIRVDAARPVHVPEWRRGETLQPADSPAAYVLSETAGGVLTIKARFRRLDAGIRDAEVRAVDPPPAAGWTWWLEWLLKPLASWPALYWAYYTWYAASLAQLQAARPPNVLGRLVPRTVTFAASGLTPFETFVLEDAAIWSRGVGVEDVIWRWQYRLAPNDPWTDLAVSSHRIYSVLEPPTAPWRQQPATAANTQLPWREVLEVACRWGAGALTLDEAAARVTQAVYDLGPRVLAYDCPGGGVTRYTLPVYPYFNCTQFLDRLRGRIGNGYYLNCTDCATIVSTFANILGCDLWQSTMGFPGPPFFGVNPVRAIGSSFWQTPCGWGAFDYHEVAWKGECGRADEVFDACLQLDADDDPTVAPHVPSLPANIVFGDSGERQYRDRLASPAGRAWCEPQPHTRLRRVVI
jgi:hypothetical protein